MAIYFLFNKYHGDLLNTGIFVQEPDHDSSPAAL